MEKKEPTREFVLNRTDPNVIEIAEINKGDKGDTYYDLQGRRVEKSAIPKKGIYIVTGRRSKAQKIMKH
ncbi:MAG: hypothetical protein IKX24_04940 [Prevotella sp.]|nr:hypothetical protein [Prevotella sp.]